MREPDLSELSAGEAALGIATAASAYFFPPLLILTLPALGLVVARRMAPGTGDGALKLLGGPVRAAQEYITTGTVPQFSLARRPETASEASQQAQRGKQAAPAPRPAPLPPAAWLRAVNEQPDDNPHMTVVGPSGTGKTTFVSAALGKRPGRVVVLTPKVSPAAWRGAEVVTLDDELSYEPIAAALESLHTEAKRRAKALQRGEPLGEPLTVVLDELPELHAEVKGLGKFAVRLSRWGRELQMRQVVLATSDDALNIPGWEATRSNYVRVELEKPTEDGRRPAWLDDGRGRHPLDLGSVKEGAERAQLQPWREPDPAPVPVSSPDPVVAADALNDLAAMLAAPVPDVSQWPDSLAAMSLSTNVPMALGSPGDTQGQAEVSLCPHVPTEGEGHRDTHSGTLVLPRDGGDLHVHLHASAEAHAPTTTPAPAPTWQRKGPVVNARARRQRATQGQPQDRADELHRLYREAGAAGRPYRAVYRELGGSKDTTAVAWREGRDSRK